MDDNPLEFITIDEMIEEIERRCSAFVVLTVRDIDGAKDVHTCRYGGGYAPAVGMMELAKAQFLDDYVNEFKRG